MSDRSGIEWTDATWNPLRGCSKVSSGCANCYAEQIAGRFSKRGQPFFGVAGQWGNMRKWTGRVDLVESKLFDPLKWKRPRRIFVNSMSDLFHEAVPDAWIDQIFAVMHVCDQHTFQVLTKRSDRMREYCSGKPARRILEVGRQILRGQGGEVMNKAAVVLFPPSNVWLGVSVENQAMADKRIPDLLATPAAVRWLSCEPLLGPIDLDCLREVAGLIDWVIVGGESGPKARPMRAEWAQSLRDQCVAAGVPFFFKQWGESLPLDQCTAAGVELLSMREAMQHALADAPVRCGKKKAGRLLDGKVWDEYPSRHAAE